MTDEELAELRRWDAIHGLDTLDWDPARRIVNWDSLRDALHDALDTIERLRSGLLSIRDGYAEEDVAGNMLGHSWDAEDMVDIAREALETASRPRARAR